MPAVHLQENSKLISGHVAEKKGYLYWVLNLTDENGKRKPKWIPTHKKVKGNKTWANNMLPTIRKEWTEKLLQEATASQQSASPSGMQQRFPLWISCTSGLSTSTSLLPDG